MTFLNVRFNIKMMTNQDENKLQIFAFYTYVQYIMIHILLNSNDKFPNALRKTVALLTCLNHY